MGMWGCGPFDNDTAADFAASLSEEASVINRAWLIIEALADALDAELKPVDLRVYALGGLLERAVAAAAFVADAHQGVVNFTDSAYARAFGDDDEPLDPPDIGMPDSDLVGLASRAIHKTMAYMEKNGADSYWRDEVAAIDEVLRGGE
jgi:hypothetical protein